MPHCSTVICCTGTCTDLVPPANGTVEVTGSSLGSVANYSCMEGFELVPAINRICQENGNWSGTDPVCGKCQPSKLADGNMKCIQNGPIHNNVKGNHSTLF